MMDSRRWAIGAYIRSVERIAARYPGGVAGLEAQYLDMTLSAEAAMAYARIQGLQRAAEVMKRSLAAEKDQQTVAA